MKRKLVISGLILFLTLHLALTYAIVFCSGESSVSCSVYEGFAKIFPSEPDPQQLAAFLKIMLAWLITGGLALTCAIIDWREKKAKKSLGFLTIILLVLSTVVVLGSGPGN
jgi:hypothetical protein